MGHKQSEAVPGTTGSAGKQGSVDVLDKGERQINPMCCGCKQINNNGLPIDIKSINIMRHEAP